MSRFPKKGFNVNNILRFTLSSLVVDTLKTSLPDNEQQPALRSLVVFLLVLYASRAAEGTVRQNGAVLDATLDSIVTDLQSIVTDALNEAKDMARAFDAENVASAPSSSSIN